MPQAPRSHGGRRRDGPDAATVAPAASRPGRMGAAASGYVHRSVRLRHLPGAVPARPGDRHNLDHALRGPVPVAPARVLDPPLRMLRIHVPHGIRSTGEGPHPRCERRNPALRQSIRRPGGTTNRSEPSDRRGSAMTATMLSPTMTATTGASAATAAPEAPADPFDVDLTIVTEIGADLLPKACGTGDGCAASCASSCASAV